MVTGSSQAVLTWRRPSMEAAKPSSGFSEEGPQISRGTLRPNIALTYRDARSAWWSECRWDRNTCAETIYFEGVSQAAIARCP